MQKQQRYRVHEDHFLYHYNIMISLLLHFFSAILLTHPP